MRRREFIAAVGGAAAAIPFTAHAQQPPIPFIGLLVAANVPNYQFTAIYFLAVHESAYGT